MSDISQIVKQQVQNGLNIEQDGSSELDRLLKDGGIETYYLDVNLYISATLELLYLQDYICESIKKQRRVTQILGAWYLFPTLTQVRGSQI